MKIKSAVGGLIIAASMAALFIPGQAAAYGAYGYCSPGVGWHMVSKKCNFQPAATWQQYDSGGYTQPVQRNGGLLFF